MNIGFAIWLGFVVFFLGGFIGLFLPKRKEKEIYTPSAEEIEKQRLLKSQDDCKHSNLRQVSGLGFAYGMGLVCNDCGKEMKEHSRKLQEDFFAMAGGLNGYKTLAEFEEARRKEQEVKRKWELTH